MLASTTLWSVLLALAVTGGIAVIAVVVGVSFLLYLREERDRPVIPWGARMRVERTKAHTVIVEEQLKQDAIEINRLALSHQRELVLTALQEGDTPAVMALGLPSGEHENGRAQDGAWTPVR